MKREATCAQFVISSFQSSALEKVNNMKRTREAEFEHCVMRINGPTRKRIKAMYGEVRQSIIAAEKSNTGEIYPGGSGSLKGQTHQIQQLYRDRHKKVDQLLKGLVQL